MGTELQVLDAADEVHFKAMSLIHALGWRTTYQDAVPADFLDHTITDDRWVDFFREDHRTGRCRGLLLCAGDAPVACCNYGPARSGDHVGWGEIISFYTNPPDKGQGYGSALMAEALERLRAEGFSRCYVLVLRENGSARRFYEKHGFHWDGTCEEISFPPDTVCVDLRYVRTL